MLSTTHRAQAACRRLPLAIAVVLAASLAAVGCSSDGESAASTTADATIVPDATAVAPGACDPAEAVDPPSIETNGVTIAATLGIADVGCAGTNGDGYISFNYNPVLVDGDGAIAVTVGDGVTTEIGWTGSTAFAESAPGTWTSMLDPSSCNRLTIRLTSASGASTATFGADIRVGGDAVDCPQRTIDPSEEPDENTGGTLAPPTSPPRTTVAPTTTAA